MYGRSDVNVKVERGSTFTFTRGFSYIVSILFTHVKPVKVYVRTHVKITRQWKSTFSFSLDWEDISNTRDSVRSHLQTPQSSSKVFRYAFNSLLDVWKCGQTRPSSCLYLRVSLLYGSVFYRGNLLSSYVLQKAFSLKKFPFVILFRVDSLFCLLVTLKPVCILTKWLLTFYVLF